MFNCKNKCKLCQLDDVLSGSTGYFFLIYLRRCFGRREGLVYPDCRQASFPDASASAKATLRRRCIGNQGRGHHVGDTLSGTPCSGLALGLNTIYCQQVRLMGNLFHNRYFFRDNLNEIDGFSHCIITFGNDYLSIFSNSSSLIKILPLAISEIFSTVLWSGI